MSGKTVGPIFTTMASGAANAHWKTGADPRIREPPTQLTHSPVATRYIRHRFADTADRAGGGKGQSVKGIEQAKTAYFVAQNTLTHPHNMHGEPRR